ncbi:MAG: alpha/beta hydrolase family protein [Solirubrobacteraceae bacterium]
MRFVDTSRSIRLPDGSREARPLLTVVRYPATGRAAGGDVRGRPPALAGGPYPLVVFGHGYAVTPTPYARLLRAWTRAGYVVAAPVFPLENAGAPGGPDETDLINQPRDMSVVISRMLAANDAPAGASEPLRGMIDARRIAVTGQSDGGETALAVAYDRYFRDPRVGAAAILSGAKIPAVGGFVFPAGSAPLLATQGTVDTVNPPSFTHAFFDIASPPKFLLTLPGADHLPPYTDGQPQLGIVERVTTAFLDRYLKGDRRALRRMIAYGEVPGLAMLRADPG